MIYINCFALFGLLSVTYHVWDAMAAYDQAWRFLAVAIMLCYAGEKIGDIMEGFHD